MRNDINNLYSYPAFSGMTKQAGPATKGAIGGAIGGLGIGIPGAIWVNNYLNGPKRQLADIYIDNNNPANVRDAAGTVLNHMNGAGKDNKPATETPDKPEQEVSSVSDFFDKHPALAWTGVGALGLGALGLGAYAMSDDDDDEEEERKYRNTPPNYPKY